MYIFQPDRVLIFEQIKRFSRYVAGDAIDIGGGNDRYRKLFPCKTLLRTDIRAGKDIDLVASADNLPLKNGMFDSAVSTQVFEHLKFPEKAAREIYRILKKGGHAVITIPQWNELHSEPLDFWRYTNYGLAELFTRNGFEVVASDQRGGFFVTGVQMVCRYFIDRLHLYSHPLVGRAASLCFRGMYSVASFLDRVDRSTANRKHAIGWCFVFRKK